jgi:hypothetical protein
MILHPIPSEFPYISGKFFFLFISVGNHHVANYCTSHHRLSTYGLDHKVCLDPHSVPLSHGLSFIKGAREELDMNIKSQSLYAKGLTGSHW